MYFVDASQNKAIEGSTEPLPVVTYSGRLVFYYRRKCYIWSTARPTPSAHIGRKISRIREMRGMKQEALAQELGVSQQTVSKMEQSEHVEEETLQKVAKALGVPAEAIKNFNDEAVLNIIANSFTSNDSSTLNAINYQPNFNPLDKVVELYERLLQSEREKVEILREMKRE